MIAYLGIFTLNLIIELTVAIIFGYRKRLEMLSVFAVNALTHPILTLLIIGMSGLGVYHIAIVLVLEVVVVVVEWQMIQFALNDRNRRYLILSIAMNVVSYGIGLLI